ncbi:MAG: hypothetical protein M3Y49_06775 [Actinomycetota bacterium]|nr:hypothetical protein [Actinomycetota bacterium]
MSTSAYECERTAAATPAHQAAGRICLLKKEHRTLRATIVQRTASMAPLFGFLVAAVALSIKLAPR